MKVGERPYELVALFADLDAMNLIEALIERGQERGCLGPFRWRSLRDPQRDALRSRPDALLEPFLHDAGCRFLLVWDHSGSGRENATPEFAGQEVVGKLVRRGVRADHVYTLVFEPEIEILLRAVWQRTKEILASLRGMTPPSDAAVRQQAARLFNLPIPERFSDALAAYPKEMLISVIRLLQLRHSATLYDTLGEQLSIQALKRDSPAVDRLAGVLRSWFPADSPDQVLGDSSAAPPTPSESRA